MAIGINPTVDFAFKKVLGSPDHPAITLHFLNAILGGDPVITAVNILTPFNEKDFDDDKLSILDVKARDDHGRWLNIEMQTTAPGELPQRLVYYAATQYVRQMNEGDRYRDLRPSIGICVLDGVLFPRVPDLHLDFRMRSQSPDLELANVLQIHLLELPKYAPPSDNGNVTNPIEKWAFFFQQAVNLTAEQLVDRLGGEAFAEAAGVLEMIAKNPRDRELYEARLKLQRDEQSRLEAAEERGEARGEAKGRVRLLCELLHRPVPNMDELTMDELAAMEQELQSQLPDRGPSS